METLWAPWRIEYIKEAPKGGCFLCDILRAGGDDRVNLVLKRGAVCAVVMNRYPYNNGHLMVIPYQHTAELDALPVDTLAEMLRLSTLATLALKRAMCPDGFNLGMNIGRTAGAGIAEHLHMHVVPRWNGDTNFMPVIGNTRVLPESLERTWEKLHAAFAAVLAGE